VTRAGWVGRGVAATALLAGACLANSLVTPIGARRPSRPAGCTLDLYPTKSPPYPYTPIATVRTGCDPVRRNTCVEQLRAEACLAGADGIVGFKESRSEFDMFIDATLIVKGVAAPGAPAGGAANACEPICSPGFACQGGHCIPQCNPPCEAAEICNRQRVCERTGDHLPGDAADQPDAASGPPTAVPKE
jgi:hypothetical protein